MSAAVIDCVSIASVAAVYFPQHLGQAAGIAGDCDQMNVVGHEAIAQNLNGIVLGVFLKEAEIDTAVLRSEEYVTTGISALRNVMTDLGNDDSSETWHLFVKVR